MMSAVPHQMLHQTAQVVMKPAVLHQMVLHQMVQGLKKPLHPRKKKKKGAVEGSGVRTAGAAAEAAGTGKNREWPLTGAELWEKHRMKL